MVQKKKKLNARCLVKTAREQMGHAGYDVVIDIVSARDLKETAKEQMGDSDFVFVTEKE